MGWLCDVYFWRQGLVLLSNCMHSVGTGLMISFPSVLNPDILSQNSSGSGIHATPDQASWIAGCNGISGLVGFCVAPYIMQTYGRKYVNMGLNFLYAFSFFILSLANNISCLFAARIIQGLPLCSVYISSVIMGEYIHSKRRGYFVSIKKTLVPIGSLLCHALGIICTWKQIAAFATIPYILAIVFNFMWPESPSFLAMTGQFAKCEKSHKQLFGDSARSKRGIEQLISSQMTSRERTKSKQNLQVMIGILGKGEFIKPFIICSLLTMIIDASGRFYMLAYVVQILTEVTKDKSIAVYCTIGADILTFVALLLSIFVIQSCRRRILLFASGTVCVFLMCLISLNTYLRSHFYIEENSFRWLTPSVILLNVFVVNIGLVPAGFTIMCEIFPLECKGIGLCALGMVFTILFFLVMKLTPLMMEKTGLEGTFSIYGFFVAVGLLLLHFILIETKDKTLQDIENEIKGVQQTKVNDEYLNIHPLMELQHEHSI